MGHPAIQNKKRETAVSQGLITFVLSIMYKHLTREQRYAIYLGKQKGETLEIIARSRVPPASYAGQPGAGRCVEMACHRTDKERAVVSKADIWPFEKRGDKHLS